MPRSARDGDARHIDVRAANRSWETLLTAHAVLMRGFASESVWRDHLVTMREYDVLYTLAKCDEPTRLGELHRHVLLSQPALSRMVDRLVSRGLVERTGDADDGRAVRLRLTPNGAELQRSVGRAHARSVARAVGGALDNDELHELERLCAKLLAGAADASMTGTGTTDADAAPASRTHPTFPTES